MQQRNNIFYLQLKQNEDLASEGEMRHLLGSAGGQRKLIQHCWGKTGKKVSSDLKYSWSWA